MLTDDNGRATGNEPFSEGTGGESASLTLDRLTRGKLRPLSGFRTLLFVYGHTTLKVANLIRCFCYFSQL